MDLIVDLRPRAESRRQPWPGSGRRLALRLRIALLDAGFSCDQICSVGSDWGFLVEPEASPIGITVASVDDGSEQWHVSASYDGGLSALWGADRRRAAHVLVARIEGVVRRALATAVVVPNSVMTPSPGSGGLD